MNLQEVAAVPDALLPLAGFKAHLQLTGLALSEAQDVLLLGHIRAAVAAIEARIAKALLRRSFTLRLAQWGDADAQPLPIAPVIAVQSVSLVRAGGESLVVAPSLYRLISDNSRPRLAGTGAALPDVPRAGWAELVFTAGFAAEWSGVPADLAQAVLLLAAEYYEYRHSADQTSAGLPLRVQSLIAPWRQLRIIGGRR